MNANGEQCVCEAHDRDFEYPHTPQLKGNVMAENPSVGRAVHYVSWGSPILPDGSQMYKPVCRAATITCINEDGSVGLCVMNPTGLFFDVTVCQNETEHVGGSWHFPERV